MPKYMQLNTRSINTSQQSLISYALIKYIDKILLQEIFTPNDLKPLTAIFSSNPNIRLRRDDPNNTGTHGGVAIFTKPTIKSIPNKTLDVTGLEACWNNTILQGITLITGSIYIPPGEIEKN